MNFWIVLTCSKFYKTQRILGAGNIHQMGPIARKWRMQYLIRCRPLELLEYNNRLKSTKCFGRVMHLGEFKLSFEKFFNKNYQPKQIFKPIMSFQTMLIFGASSVGMMMKIFHTFSSIVNSLPSFGVSSIVSSRARLFIVLRPPTSFVISNYLVRVKGKEFQLTF